MQKLLHWSAGQPYCPVHLSKQALVCALASISAHDPKNADTARTEAILSGVIIVAIPSS
jgi:hypothetical protein